LFILWWDEYDPAPILFYGIDIKQGYVSASNNYDHYSVLRMIEDNWALPTLTGNDAAATGLGAEIFGSTSPISLITSFTYNPVSPLVGSTVTFTSSTTGGVGPYSYSWAFGDGTSSTGPTATHAYTQTGNYTVTLNVKDSASNSYNALRTLTVFSSSGNNSASTVPILIGWGGVRLDEATVGGGVNHPTNPPPSLVFPGETATNMELLLIELKNMGYNTVRVDFDPYCTGSQYMSPYNATNLQRAIQIAEHYGFWIIIDYHGYSDMFNTTTSSCWLNFWASVTNQFKSSYSHIIWEPLNEPCYGSGCPDGITNNVCSGGAACVPVMSHEYQLWINQTRGQGDTHWIVVQNICSYGCSLNNWANGYPTVTDPLGKLPTGKIFISLHSYMGYSSFSNNWNNATAESYAQQNYQTVVTGITTTGWPALNTEGGADPLCNSCAPDKILTGSAGYSTTTLHFIQTLTNLYDTNNNPQRINWAWWPAGSWTDTPNAGIYGAMQCASSPPGWGCLLRFHPIQSLPDFELDVSPSATANIGTSAISTLTLSFLNGFTGTVALSIAVPSGITCNTAGKTSLNHNDTVAVTCTSTVSGYYIVTVTGRSGALAHSLAVPFTFSNPSNIPPPATTGQGICITCIVTSQWDIIVGLCVLGGIVGFDLSIVAHHRKARAQLAIARNSNARRKH
jgi:PKD repeat protein